MYDQRKIQYLSPTSIKIFDTDIEEFAVKYLIQDRPPREPQTQPMSVGSSFDAYAKSYLYHALNGNYGPDDKFRFDVIFESQVEAQNRDWAKAAGKDCFDKYQKCGALADLMTELNSAIGRPRFEFSISDVVTWQGYGVPLLGKPDIYFMNDQGIRVIYDWKVNGYCSSRNTSPMKGYVVCRDLAKNSRGPHKDAVLSKYKGVTINVMGYLEEFNREWADQLSVYSWLMGEAIDSEDVIFGIDQITGPGCSRISSHRLRVSTQHRINFMERICQIWRIIESGHIFRTLSREESDSRLKILEEQYKNNPMEEYL